jgi:tryptophan-rich sensory protein
MDDFAILTNRKRALIALAHSIIFLGIALRGFASLRQALWHAPGLALGGVLLLIYLAVGSILAWLTRLSQCAKERAYFAFCACSATSGFLRTLFGDATLPAAQYLRVIMLTCAVLTGLWILRSYSLVVVSDWNRLQGVTPTPQEETARE